MKTNRSARESLGGLVSSFAEDHDEYLDSGGDSWSMLEGQERALAKNPRHPTEIPES